jgi:uncharacterized membrane protein
MLPSLGVYHPQIVHFAIVLLVTGVVFRLVSLSGKLAFTGPSALALILAGTVAAILATKSGTEAHGPVERIPGVRAAVQEHEEWGERTRTVFLIIAAFEIGAFVIRRQPWQKVLLVGSGAIGLFGIYAIYETGEHGGSLVYSYAGGVGIRSGEPDDVGRLLLAGLYNQAMLDRREGRHEEAAGLIDELGRRFGDDPTIALLAIESRLVDRNDPAGTLEALRAWTPPVGNRMVRFRTGFLEADAWEASGLPDSARAALDALLAEFPDNGRIQQRIDRIGGSEPD